MGGGGGGGNHKDTFVTTIGFEKPKTKMQKVGNSLSGLLIGPVFIFFGCFLLWYNEEWAVKTYRSLNEALDAHVELPNANRAAPEHRGRLVHLTQMATVDGKPVEDPVFGLTRPNTISLERQVEIYQWVEDIKTKKVKKGDLTEVQEVVNYNKKWVRSPIDSSGFRHPEGHENCCGSLPLNAESFRADQIQLGIYSMSHGLAKQMNRSQHVPPSYVKTLPEGAVSSPNAIFLPRGGGSGETQALLPADDGIELQVSKIDGEEKVVYVVKATGDSYSTREKALAAANANAIEERVTRVDGHEKILYVVKATGDSFSSREKALAAAVDAAPARMQQSNRQLSQRQGDEIGDVKITFSEVPCAVVSVLAAMSESGDALVPWRNKQGSGYEVLKLSYGVKSAAEMIQDAQTGNTVKTWVFRFSGWLLNFIGYNMITSIISTTADITLNWIPLLGPMAMTIINLGVSIANFVMANCTTMIVASIAWIFYRPVLGVSLLTGSIGLFFMASQAGRRKPGNHCD